ncbi:unannotated protein [freshwater metagenome]|uniref:Unannotated protein n=1 Tax=freshwater metagenome TaxID=449393 RepID=A0A6J7LJI7_9ZZZZ
MRTSCGLIARPDCRTAEVSAAMIPVRTGAATLVPSSTFVPPPNLAPWTRWPGPMIEWPSYLDPKFVKRIGEPSSASAPTASTVGKADGTHQFSP